MWLMRWCFLGLTLLIGGLLPFDGYLKGAFGKPWGWVAGTALDYAVGALIVYGLFHLLRVRERIREPIAGRALFRIGIICFVFAILTFGLVAMGGFGGLILFGPAALILTIGYHLCIIAGTISFFIGLRWNNEDKSMPLSEGQSMTRDIKP